MNLRHTFSRRILAGLVFSCFGDALIVWPNMFLGGMGMFALAQIMYITAFGFVPLNAQLGAFLYALCGLGNQPTDTRLLFHLHNGFNPLNKSSYSHIYIDAWSQRRSRYRSTRLHHISNYHDLACSFASSI